MNPERIKEVIFVEVSRSDDAESTTSEKKLISLDLTRSDKDLQAKLEPESPSLQAAHFIKLAVLVWLAFQAATLTLLLRYSRSRHVTEMFFPSVAIFLTEIVKAAACLCVVFGQNRSFFGAFRLIREQVFTQYLDTLKVCIPSVLFICQNNLTYVAASNLEASTFMILMQVKVFTTAIFSVLLLKRKLASIQWISLFVLAAGVVFVQLDGDVPREATNWNMNLILGVSTIAIACILTGFANVFFEQILKEDSPVSFWMRHLQISAFAVPASFIGVFAQNGDQVSQKGFLYGVDRVIWAVIVWYAVGGISVALCLKYASSISKNFATSASIILASIGSIYLFNSNPSSAFFSGTLLVVASGFLYFVADFVPSIRK